MEEEAGDFGTWPDVTGWLPEMRKSLPGKSLSTKKIVYGMSGVESALRHMQEEEGDFSIAINLALCNGLACRR